MQKFFEKLSYPTLFLASLLLGLAPFTTQPHLFQKLGMLLSGTLNRPLDIFDFLFHLSPFLLLMLKILVQRLALRNTSRRSE